MVKSVKPKAGKTHFKVITITIYCITIYSRVASSLDKSMLPSRVAPRLSTTLLVLGPCWDLATTTAGCSRRRVPFRPNGVPAFHSWPISSAAGPPTERAISQTKPEPVRDLVRPCDNARQNRTNRVSFIVLFVQVFWAIEDKEVLQNLLFILKS